MFFNSLGGAIAISIAQNIFSNGLVAELHAHAPGVDTATIVNAGATHIRGAASAAQLPGVLRAYSAALAETFILPIAGAGLALLVSFMVRAPPQLFTPRFNLI